MNKINNKTRPDAAGRRSANRWWALVVLALAQFLVVLDASIVNIALPALGEDLALDTTALSWIITAYVLPFGGLLLLGGRLADRYGHRRIFMIGILGFAAASAAAGLASSGGWLLAARAVQGASAALLAPAALALVTKLFTEPGDRAKALGIWGAVAGIGSAAGVLLGGVLTGAFGWAAVFFVNVPIGFLVLIAIPALVTKDTLGATAKTDMPGAITVTAGLTLFVYALSEGERAGWASPVIGILLAAAIVLLTAFVIIEKRSANPLVPFSIFRNRSVLAGNVATLLIGGATTGLFFALSVYMQAVLHYDALTAGLTQLPLAIALVVAAGAVPGVMKKIGPRMSLAASLLVFAAGLVWLSLAPSDASFAAHLLAPTIVLGAGLGGAFVTGTQLAVHGVSQQDDGLASGLVNTSQQIGGAVGLILLGMLSSSRTASLLASGKEQTVALSGGFSWVFLGAALLAVIGAAVAVVLRGRSANREALLGGETIVER
ncbi:DHA2 family efflux MFS transporter permease subunit [Paenibacillus harenae]|uniref:DHA2 family efflux MFS transporter permease subunit n=1 Tax=Paenibacillus harenae TaxID=306543 RepID=UPI002793B8E8|nr:DHA2 family efflux MFS transporter permease subunit [Paenibacillus harenae]MDQ0062863.1 EmrB/QacA subfamily drug resistance transporter [Paenibacillus harenae]